MSIKSKLDQFYTSPLIVDIFLNKIIDLNLINKNSYIIEPSAGDGKFIDGFQRYLPENDFIAFDIEKNHPLVNEQDFLKTNLLYSPNNIVIGNPPFGNRATLAVDFINHSAEFSDVICFVLPIQFKRWNVQKQINPELKLIYSSDNLPYNSFLLNNKPYNVNSFLQIWVRDRDNKFDDLRIKEAPQNKHSDFSLYIHNNTKETLKYFDKQTYDWDFAVHRQGYYDYNKKILNESELITNRQYLFIKINNPIANEVFKHIDFDKLANSNTVVKGFSNTDLVKEYIEIKKNISTV
ncbi:DNA methylase [Metamycoplasma cloacale]|uniref:SAM-dependent methyltransferase n=1 Tax=Metamycoplasma cloacale TaxID=92401 RepID=A0A2Z4LM07_9BACT|nr:hypothetical protein [Metamycoplasma cloacale]AWX42766.1 SAM-dependent methyltransferase [Metamycoplasma cloacale]VEU79419.1 DNA methylase [Metamycoplasma cloacale]